MPTRDLILDTLRSQPGPLGALATTFPGNSGALENPHWIDEWFVDQATAFLRSEPPDQEVTSSDATAEIIAPLRKPPATNKVRLKSIQPNYFRGFRTQLIPIELDADLIVVEGRNSSGKTALAEAFEWLFTGQLSRRSSGHARELASCIGNEFRPADAKTWVEAVIMVDSEERRLRRVLTADYADTQAATTTSDLVVDGNTLTPAQAALLLDQLFAGVAPILMQHTLSHFIHGTPDTRRRYFERLLQLDELTGLIEKAVVGDARSAEFVPAVGALRHSRWRLLRDAVSPSSKRACERFERTGSSPNRSGLERVMQDVGAAAFRPGAVVNASFGDFVTDIRADHIRDRERQFPFLNDLRPRPGTAQFLAFTDSLSAVGATLAEAMENLSRAQETARDLAAAELAIARAVDSLIKGGVLGTTTSEWSTCPLCEYIPVPTLSSRRVTSLHACLPLAAAVDNANTSLSHTARRAGSDIRGVRTHLAAVIIPGIDEQEQQLELSALDPSVVLGIVALNASVRRQKDLAMKVVGCLDTADTLLEDGTCSAALVESLRTASTRLAQLRQYLTEYASQFAEVEKTLGIVALGDPSYALREKWLDVVDDLDGVLQAVGWERAEGKAQKLLKSIREGLISLRSELVEAARRDFSERMTEVWRMLREDTASTFSQLYIPEAKGRGFKLEMEVKARISDGTRDVEVDALKVFSESQINVVGLAAYLTRAKLLGHAVVILDDPVQSMDEDHYLSLAGPLTEALIAQDFQIVLLTHSDQFARDVADAHYKRKSFLTLRSRATKRYGVVIEEGNRRVTERLKNAERFAENADLESAWIRIRLALERLYLLVFMKANPNFDPRSWRSQTGEQMWVDGSGAIIEAAVPGSGERLKSILKRTAAGAHEGLPRGAKDLKDTATFIRSLLNPLQIGDG